MDSMLVAIHGPRTLTRTVTPNVMVSPCGNFALHACGVLVDARVEDRHADPTYLRNPSGDDRFSRSSTIHRPADDSSMETHVLAVILARAGSKGLPNKNTLSLAGRPMIAYTIEQARRSERIDAVCVTTDSPRASDVARAAGVFIVNRPPELASDTATVDAAARHAVETYEQDDPPVTHVVILYANVPIRASGIIDRVVGHLVDTGADSVRTLAAVTKQHPDWLHRLDGDRMVQLRENSIYRRQDLEPLYYHDGAVVAVTREALFTTSPNDHHAFLGTDRRGVVQNPGDTVDIDSIDDFQLAEAILHARRQRGLTDSPAPIGTVRQ
ncbi:MAG: acylneuraminate cytidylyltransferase family protein [Phycisphaerae bacterium]|nr:acylneuraminate cytidylyltransferase family protein [Phycisphaerae bacterium]